MVRGVEAAGGAERNDVEGADRGALRTPRLPVERVVGAELLKRCERDEVETETLDCGARVLGTTELKEPRGTVARTVRGVGRLDVGALRVELTEDVVRVLRTVGAFVRVVARVLVDALERVDVARGFTDRVEGAVLDWRVPVVRVDVRVGRLPEATGFALRASALVKVGMRVASPRRVMSCRVDTLVRSA